MAHFDHNKGIFDPFNKRKQMQTISHTSLSYIQHQRKKFLHYETTLIYYIG